MEFVLQIIFGAFVAFILAILIWLWRERAQPIPGLPVVQPNHFWFGNLLDAIKTRNQGHDRNVEIMKMYGPAPFTSAFPFRGGTGTLWLPCDEKLSEYVHKTAFNKYQKGPLLTEILEEIIGNGIFAVNGKAWRDQRKTASHIFSGRALKEDMAPVFLKHGLTALEILSKTAETGAPINIQDLFFRYTITAFSEIGFGEDIQALTRDVKEIPFAQAFDVAQQHMVERPLDPFWKLKRSFNNLIYPAFKGEKAIKESIAVMDNFATRVIAERKRDKVGNNLVVRFIDDAKEKGEELTEKFLRDLVLNFLIAGRDTTACALSWMMYCLCLNPEVEAKMYEEIQRVAGDSELGFENTKDLVYTEAVLYETLRLYPSVPFEFKTCVEDDVMPNGIKVPAGSMVLYSPYVWGRHERLWTDPTAFKPERWLGEEGKHSQYKYVTFNAGPRLCLGKHVALLEGKLLASMIVQKFKLKLVNPKDITYQMSITMPVKNGLHVYVERRKKDI